MNKRNLIVGIGNCFGVACGIGAIISIAKIHKKSLEERNETNSTNWTNARDCVLVIATEASLSATTIKYVGEAIYCFRHLK